MFRRSKFKHVFGKPNKKEFCYDNIRITKSSWDSTFCSVNPKFIAVITEAAGGGSFLVLPVEKYGRIEPDTPLVAGHKATVLDIQWCPFNDHLIASASEDCTVKVWAIPDHGLKAGQNLTEPVADLVAHQRRVGLVEWHPTAEHVLLSAGADNMIFIWNVYNQEIMMEIPFPDMVMCASFNYDGSRFVCTCKDRKTRIVDPRTGSVIKEGSCHDGNKPQRAVYLKQGRIFTTGFSKMSERQMALWHEDNFNKALEFQDLDSSNGVLFPFYDSDTSMIFLCGKGDSNIRYFEVTDEAPYLFYLSTFQSSDPQRGMGFMPKRGLDVNSNEIVRFYKLHTKGLCEVIPFTVPRKSELFQDDLYPDTASDEPALTAEDWMSGKDAEPILMSLKEGFVSKERAQLSKLSMVGNRAKKQDLDSNHAGNKTNDNSSVAGKLSNATAQPGNQSVNSSTTTTPTAASASAASSPPAAVVAAAAQPGLAPKELQQLLDDMRKLKIIIKGHEKRIKVLENRLKESGCDVVDPSSISTVPASK